jgi:hypothetical protein
MEDIGRKTTVQAALTQKNNNSNNKKPHKTTPKKITKARRTGVEGSVKWLSTCLASLEFKQYCKKKKKNVVLRNS